MERLEEKGAGSLGLRELRLDDGVAPGDGEREREREVGRLEREREGGKLERPPISTTMFANFNEYGLWDSITGDLFSSEVRDSEVHHARQRSADLLNLDGLSFGDDVESERKREGRHGGHGGGRGRMSSKQNKGRAAAVQGSLSSLSPGSQGSLSPSSVSPSVPVPVSLSTSTSVSPLGVMGLGGGADGQVDTADKVKRTVYVADLHYLVSEQELSRFFARCGPLVDFRICGDTNTVLRFAFVEFHSVKSAKAALKLTGSVLGESTIRVSPSKTAIIPVKDQFLPRSERERDLVAKTVYVANIHPTVERDVLKQFFQMVCGPVSKIRLLGDAQHDTKIAFVEFASKDSTAAALRCTGAMLGPLAIRVSPSKTPVRTDARRRSGGVEAHVPADAATAAAKISGQIRSNLSKQGEGIGELGVGSKKGTRPGSARHGNGTGGVGSGSGSGGRKGAGPRLANRRGHNYGDPSDASHEIGMTGASPTIMSLLESILTD